MKPFIEKLPPSEDSSFLACTYRTPDFEVSWHQHPELELILFTEGEGTSFIGNYIGEFKTGDIFFLGSNLPHTFQKAHKDLITSAVLEGRDGSRRARLGSDLRQLPDAGLGEKPLAKICRGL